MKHTLKYYFTAQLPLYLLQACCLWLLLNSLNSGKMSRCTCRCLKTVLFFQIFTTWHCKKFKSVVWTQYNVEVMPSYSFLSRLIQVWMNYKWEGWDECVRCVKGYYYMFQRGPFLPAPGYENGPKAKSSVPVVFFYWSIITLLTWLNRS